MDRVKLLGTRGSLPCSGTPYLHYGGNTLCIRVELAGETLVLDCGSGMLNLKAEDCPSLLHVLLTHAHADHILGLPMCPALLRKDQTVDIYAAPMGGLSAEDQVRAYLHPPLWPIGPEALPAKIRFLDLTPTLSLGAVQVDSMPGVHPGGVTLLRLRGDGKTVVLATDCTYTEDLLPSLSEFARDCDLLLCDGQYSDEEWPARKDFGHNTWRSAAALGARCGAKAVRVIHHAPGRSDGELDAAAKELTDIHPNCRFGYDEEEILL